MAHWVNVHGSLVNRNKGVRTKSELIKWGMNTGFWTKSELMKKGMNIGVWTD
jgi:hypothetical protein